MNDANRYTWIKQYVRRKWGSDLVKLKAMADELFGLSTEDVVITAQGFEGGSASGQATFRKEIVSAVLEDLIAELDDTVDTGTGGGAHLDFSTRCIEP